MSIIKHLTSLCVWGVPATKLPVTSEIPGKIRLRFYNRGAAMAFVMTDTGIVKAFLENKVDHWEILWKNVQRENARLNFGGHPFKT